MITQTATLHKGFDDWLRIEVEPLSAGLDFNVDAITDTHFIFNGVTVKQTEHPLRFSWVLEDVKVLYVKPALLLTEDTDFVRLILFDGANPNGIVWMSEYTYYRLLLSVYA